jgi:hypothetical protein
LEHEPTRIIPFHDTDCKQNSAYKTVPTAEREALFDRLCFSGNEIVDRTRWRHPQKKKQKFIECEKGRKTKRQISQEIGVSFIANFGQRDSFESDESNRTYSIGIIKKIIPIGITGVWDVEVDEDHSYSAQGFINHNSQNPNLQNLPRDAYDVKGCFEADPNMIFVKADLAQAEFRCWAHYSGDEDLLADIHSGMDIHSITASRVFDVTVEELDNDKELREKYRTPAKRATFGMMFGVGPKHVAEEFDIDVKEAKKILKVVYEKYPVAVNWLQEQVKIARRKGELVSWLGRKRRLPHINSDDQNRKGDAERQAKNCRIQILATAMNDHYMTTTLATTKEKGIHCYPSMTIHDANIYQVRKGQVDEFVEVAKKVVADEFPEFRCEMKLDFEIGDTLGTLKEI